MCNTLSGGSEMCDRGSGSKFVKKCGILYGQPLTYASVCSVLTHVDVLFCLVCSHSDKETIFQTSLR